MILNWLFLLLLGVRGLEDSFLAREQALSDYSAGRLALLADVGQAEARLLASFRAVPTAHAARLLSWLCEMSGDAAGAQRWQALYAQLEQPAVLRGVLGGISQHHAGRYTQAMASYREALGADADSVDALFHMGLAQQAAGAVQRAAEWYTRALAREPHHGRSLLNLATLHHKYGDLDEALYWYRRGLDVFEAYGRAGGGPGEGVYFLHPHRSMLLYNLGVLLFQQARLQQALDAIVQLLDLLLPATEVLGVGPVYRDYAHLYTPRSSGSISGKRTVNRGRRGADAGQAVAETEAEEVSAVVWEVQQTVATALGTLFKVRCAAGQWAHWEELVDRLLGATLEGVRYNARKVQAQMQMQAQGGGERQEQGQEGQEGQEWPRQESGEGEGEGGEAMPSFLGPLLPFDTLMLPVSLSDRLAVAAAASSAYRHTPFVPYPTSTHTSNASSSPAAPTDTDPALSESASGSASASGSGAACVGSEECGCACAGSVLRVGFLSFDFNDHPTAHLVEAIFRSVRKQAQAQAQAQAQTEVQAEVQTEGQADSNSTTDACTSKCTCTCKGAAAGAGGSAHAGVFGSVQLIVFSYGKDDGSVYRQDLQSLAHEFVDLSALSFAQAGAQIRLRKVDVLLDLQLHTLGSRLEISASGAAPCLVNYLVYPGTSGAAFMHYLLADRVTVPAEHARHYSEALLLLPPSYQISTYDRYPLGASPAARALQRAELGSGAGAETGVRAGAVTGERAGAGVEAEVGAGAGTEAVAMEALHSPPLSPLQYHHALLRQRLHLRLQNGLPADLRVTVFCNFNKGSKIDPHSFALWMGVLRRVPHSVLWLLDPHSASHRATQDSADQRSSTGSDPTHTGTGTNTSTTSTTTTTSSSGRDALLAAAAHFGVAPDRLHFAGRAAKTAHIERHAAADLFLDTLVYGAHSTATDALRGGLAVLTLLGESFPNRVAASLLHSLDGSGGGNGAGVSGGGGNGDGDSGARDSGVGGGKGLADVLVVHSLRDFEDTAVRIAGRGSRRGGSSGSGSSGSSGSSGDSSQTNSGGGDSGGGDSGGSGYGGGSSATLARWLDSCISQRRGLFDADANVRVFLRAVQALHEEDNLHWGQEGQERGGQGGLVVGSARRRRHLLVQ